MKIHILSTLRNYDKNYLKQDIFSGIIIAAVSIPISMGYAQISGLPAVYGLYGSVLPILLFAIFSTSRQFIFGVDAAPAALAGSALLTLGITPGSREALNYVSALALFTGLWLLFLFYPGRPNGQLHLYACHGWIYQRYRFDDYFNANTKAYGKFRGIR